MHLALEEECDNLWLQLQVHKFTCKEYYEYVFKKKSLPEEILLWSRSTPILVRDEELHPIGRKS